MWVPLQDTPKEMGPLAFSPASHKVDLGRSFKIGDQSENEISASLKVLYFPISFICLIIFQQIIRKKI